MPDHRPDLRLPRAKRLLQADAFRQVFARPARSSDGFFNVAARRRCESCDPHDVPARLGLAVSRKALPRAVDRNRVKRIVRETFRQMHFCGGLDVVVVGRAGLRDADNAAVRRSISDHFAALRRRLCRQSAVH
ncbi:ribonuclease P protein component [Thiohalocapsa sp.]|uniref:ribonuclease P protein component n=1 Tax=Thiohalocapsa sp. TaxID=2497641 RepID=UPI00345C1B4F